MSYFVTGGTGFIGRFLIENLLKRDGNIYTLVRASSREKLAELAEKLGDTEGRIIPVVGDLTQTNLGVSDDDLASLKGNVEHFFHLAAIYDLSADADSQYAANVEGTRNAMGLAEAVSAGCFHHTSSIAAAGLYKGTFREDMFEEAKGLDDPYLKTKHDSEGLVRSDCKIPYRIYRPSMVVGHSQTGEIDKIDGPYYFFKMIQKLRKAMPQWVPLPGLEGGRINIVPVDFVANAMDHIAHKDGLDGGCFHLVDPNAHKVGEVLNIFADAGHAPSMVMRVNTRMFNFIPPFIRQTIKNFSPVKQMTDTVLKDLGIPRSVLSFIEYPTKFDNRETERALEGTSIECPSLDSYAAPVWDYWERNLDPDLFIDRTLDGQVKDKVVIVTGASSGIGKTTALKLGRHGAKLILAARSVDKLEEVKQEIIDEGGQAFTYSVDLSEDEPAQAFVQQVISDHGQVDILVNNAGRSIRRAISASTDRFHDFTRCMDINYYGCLRLILGLLPHMEKTGGHVINISSIGVLTNSPRFSAYVASKAALDAFTRCAAAEYLGKVHFTTINMPLVRTPMIGPTSVYNNVPTLTPDEAADMITNAIIYRPKRVATRLGTFAQVIYAVSPKMADIVMNTGFRMFGDSKASQSTNTSKGDAPKPDNQEQAIFSAIMRGIHW